MHIIDWIYHKECSCKSIYKLTSITGREYPLDNKIKIKKTYGMLFNTFKINVKYERVK